MRITERQGTGNSLAAQIEADKDDGSKKKLITDD